MDMEIYLCFQDGQFCVLGMNQGCGDETTAELCLLLAVTKRGITSGAQDPVSLDALHPVRVRI